VQILKIKIKLFKCILEQYQNIIMCKSLHVLSCILKIILKLNVLCIFGFSIYKALVKDYSAVW